MINLCLIDFSCIKNFLSLMVKTEQFLTEEEISHSARLQELPQEEGQAR